MVLTYQNILETLPVSFRDYIRNNKEWIMILNNAVRRAVMGSRRFNQLSTDAPLPIGITSAPLCDKVDGLRTYDSKYKFPRADFMLTNFGITDWTNEINNDYSYITIRQAYIVDKGNGVVSIKSVCFGDGVMREQFVNAANHDLTYIYSNNPHNAEYIILKYSHTDWIENGVQFYDPASQTYLTDWGTHYYTAEYVYMRPVYNLRAQFNVPAGIYVCIIAGAPTNKKIDYYFTPQHTFDSLWYAKNFESTPIYNFGLSRDIMAEQNIFWLNNIDRNYDYTYEWISWLNNQEYWTSRNYPQAESMQPLINKDTAFDEYNPVTVDLFDGNNNLITRLNLRAIYFTPCIHDDIDNFDTPLIEACLTDPILMNLIRLEVIKSFYEFIQDTTDPQRLDMLSGEIEKETSRVKITLNSVPIATEEYKQRVGSSSAVSTLAGSGNNGLRGWS